MASKPNSDVLVISEDELREVLLEIFRKSQIDPDFRDQCLKDAGAAIFQVSGKILPDGSTLEFLEETLDQPIDKQMSD